MSGKEILSNMSGIETDSKGNNISEWENYIMLESFGEVIVVPEKYYYYSLKKAVSLIYKQFGFDHMVNIIETDNNPVTLKDKDEIVEGILELLIENEDYEFAEKLKIEYQNYLKDEQISE